MVAPGMVAKVLEIILVNPQLINNAVIITIITKRQQTIDSIMPIIREIETLTKFQEKYYFAVSLNFTSLRLG